DRIVPDSFSRHVGDGLARDACLLIRVRENDRAVLRPDVAALSILRRWIVNREEHVEQIAIRDLRRIVRDLYDFGVASIAAAHFAIRGIRLGSTSVARHDALDALQLAIDAVEAPEAAAAKGGYLTLSCD